MLENIWIKRLAVKIVLQMNGVREENQVVVMLALTEKEWILEQGKVKATAHGVSYMIQIAPWLY